MIIHILSRQKLYRPNVGKLKTLAKFFLNKSAIAGKENISELSLVLTDDAGIRPINRQFFDRDCNTDVISFLLKPSQKREHAMGEIVINVEQAVQEGKKRRGFEHEFALYLAHGCDHLAGFNDRTAAERGRMHRRELRWLKEAARVNLPANLFKPF
jgi:rRNA maturation RNase YbeY